jgi:hypothetical protein
MGCLKNSRLPEFLFSSNLIFLCLKTPYKISDPYDILFWEKSNPGRKKREEKKPSIIVDT